MNFLTILKFKLENPEQYERIPIEISEARAW